MRRVLQASLLTSAIVAGAVAGTAAPAFAQMDQSDQMYQSDNGVSFDSFHDQLAPYGYWLYSDRWGIVWQPGEVSEDFQPYYAAGHWAYTDNFGWLWQSDYVWGDIPFHYGRWVNDPEDGWLWIPGYVWSPGWVTWRSNGQYIGWMPMPPDDAFLQGRGDAGFGVSFRFGVGEIGGLYGYSRWYGPEYDESRFARNWVFVSLGHVADRDYRRVAVRNPVEIVDIIHRTRNVTNYTVVNNYVVNRSIDVRVVERAAGHPIAVVRAASVIRHPNLVTRVDVGQRVQVRMRAVAPRGMGVANSAPPPPAGVVAKLSARVSPRSGQAPTHLFTKTTVAAPEAQTRFHGPAVRSPAGAPGGVTGPNGERTRNENQPGGPGPMTGPNSERMRNENQPGGANGTTAPNGERMRNENQPGGPNGTTGPNGERMRNENQPGGPNGTTGPNGERMRNESQPSGPGAMTGPNGERMRNENQPGGPNGTTGPNGERMRNENQPGGQNGMTGPNGERMRNENQPGGPGAMTGPNGERMRNENQPGGPNGTTGPNGERMRNENQPGGPGAMTGPNAERTRGEPQQPAGGPGGMAGPQGPRPQSPAAKPQAPNPNGTAEENQKKKKKEPQPNPPQ